METATFFKISQILLQLFLKSKIGKDTFYPLGVETVRNFHKVTQLIEIELISATFDLTLESDHVLFNHF